MTRGFGVLLDASERRLFLGLQRGRGADKQPGKLPGRRQRRLGTRSAGGLTLQPSVRRRPGRLRAPLLQPEVNPPGVTREAKRAQFAPQGHRVFAAFSQARLQMITERVQLAWTGGSDGLL